MKKFILIQNDGEIETNSFELIGASTKRSDSTKIGFFGSGLKYSIAYMMRKGIGFKVFSGSNEINFSTIKESLKGQEFERICINGNPTSYTTTMGPTWKEDWFVLREIYCNALDENGCQIIKETEDINPSEGKTRIYIEMTDALKQVSGNWDTYFSEDRTPLFTSDSNIYTCFLGHEDNGINHQSIMVYPKTEGVLYRKGIRVYSNKRYLYDYGCAGVNINEDRTAKNPNGLHYGLFGLVATLSNEEYVKSVLRSSEDIDTAEEFYALSTGDKQNRFSQKWVKFSNENLLVVREISGRYAEEINKSKKECFQLPSLFARELKKAYPECKIMGMGSVIGDVSANKIEPTPKMLFLLKEVMASLEEMNYKVPFDVDVVQFDEDNVMGKADMENKRILIADTTFDMGRREIAMTLMEETEHLKSGKEDETRAFQTHIFSQWLTSMENANGLFL